MANTTPLNLSRRTFLRTGSLAAGLSLSEAADVGAAPVMSRAKSCIVLWLLGGPSQLETFDPKPNAPAEVRGPFRSIATSVPGIHLSEHLPRLAQLAHRFSLLRTVHHTAAPIHETGLQLLQTGRLGTLTRENPHFGAVLAQQQGASRVGVSPFVVLPSLIGNTGMNISHGQGAGWLGSAHEPHVLSHFRRQLSSTQRQHYGKTAFGDACLQALNLVEQGTRSVVVNMFSTLYDCVSWDCHGERLGFTSTLDDYRRTLCPTFDQAAARLLEDLHERGMLEETLVVAMGELGRSPRLNARGGRDHWPACWSILLAGGGIRGGQVIGRSDRYAAEPADRPIRCAEVVASIYAAMGIPPGTQLVAADRTLVPLVDAAPIRELLI